MPQTTRRTQALALLAATGMQRGTYEPLLFRLLWRLGIDIPPPHFMSFGAAAGLLGTSFTVVWSSMMWLLVWRHQPLNCQQLATGVLLAGGLFGLSMASYYAWSRRRHALPEWAALAGASQPASTGNS
ncbi:hypothetical protein HNQ50_002437 [Silvimonas terrae]|uniref:Uncharacterized protein n=1 Tax=Silvimonas terrae TaxID=300266 RepID=A0A840RFB0_9NEIS|nr:DUF6404 family protein [Silvimonas terrae]MBB5191707.1 hypothetical protein [Silvimonas terrae]